jgi:hypothetical protein
VTYESGATVIADGSRTGQLLILKTGAVVILKNGIEIAEVGEAGAVFGELSVLLDQPHTADEQRRGRIFCEQRSCIGYVKLRGSQGADIGCVRLIEQN